MRLAMISKKLYWNLGQFHKPFQFYLPTYDLQADP